MMEANITFWLKPVSQIGCSDIACPVRRFMYRRTSKRALVDLAEVDVVVRDEEMLRVSSW